MTGFLKSPGEDGNGHARMPSWMFLTPNKGWGLWGSNNILAADITL